MIQTIRIQTSIGDYLPFQICPRVDAHGIMQEGANDVLKREDTGQHIFTQQ